MFPRMTLQMWPLVLGGVSSLPDEARVIGTTHYYGAVLVGEHPKDKGHTFALSRRVMVVQTWHDAPEPRPGFTWRALPTLVRACPFDFNSAPFVVYVEEVAPCT